jgi:hypothetical protein
VPRSYEAIELLRRLDSPKPGLVLLDWKISGGGASVLRMIRCDPSLAITRWCCPGRRLATTYTQPCPTCERLRRQGRRTADFQEHVAAICEFFLRIAQPTPMPDTL